MTQLYPVGQAYRDFHLAVGEGHQLHIQEYGDPQGIPVLVCHGGPGAGLNNATCRYFNPEHYRLILFSQRGCGLSTPHYELQHNTTAHLINDIEQIRQALAISSWLITGESWGATLALLYSFKYTDHVAGLLLRSTFLAKQKDIEWLFGPLGAPAQMFPEFYLRFKAGQQDASHILKYYQKALYDSDELTSMKAAKIWCEWESVLSGMYPNHHAELKINNPQRMLDIARLENHYFAHNCFIDDDYICNNVDKLQHTPIWLLHGRQDLICPFSDIYFFSQQLKLNPNLKFDILNEVGHSAEHPHFANAIRLAADRFYCLIKKRI